MRNKISLCMIVKNEEEYLPKCLNSIADVADEIIIVDTGSTDRTVDIANSFGAKVYFYKWNNNFSEARNVSLKYATKDWILILDADDEFTSENKENLKLLLRSELDEKAIYYFETLNYYGDKVDNNCITINLNPRMFKNNREIHYEGEIHNQLVYTHDEYDAICNEIKIHHYGYLNKSIEIKEKRKRNITILKEQIKKDPIYKFNYFNLGNEYAALNDYEKALENYYKAYENFDPHTGFSAILLLRIIVCNYNIQNYNKALDFISIAAGYYPKYTDIYFFKALVFKDLNKPTLQIKALEKCLELGEAPSELKFFFGSGSFKAYYELGNAYRKLNDSDTAYEHYIKAVNSNPDFIDPLRYIIDILKERGIPHEELKTKITSFFTDPITSYPILVDLFYNAGNYDIALEYIEKLKEGRLVTDDLAMHEAKCLIRTGAFEECIKLDTIKKESLSFVHFTMYKILCNALDDNYDYALDLLNKFDEDTLSEYNKKLLRAYSALIKLFNEEKPDMLSEDETQKDYIYIILELCEILLINKYYEELEIAVNLLGLINNKFVHLYLGKLYYYYGYTDVAKKEILKSINEFEIYDNESLDMLKD